MQHRDMIFGFRVGFSGSADLFVQHLNVKNPRWWLTAILDIENCYNFATGLPIEVMSGSRVGFLAELRFLPYGPSYIHCCRA